MWKIVQNLSPAKGCKLHQSHDYLPEKDAQLIHKFRLLDDDNNAYCIGLSDTNDSDSAFDPLDDYGEGMFGCVKIEYLNDGRWAQL